MLGEYDWFKKYSEKVEMILVEIASQINKKSLKNVHLQKGSDRWINVRDLGAEQHLLQMEPNEMDLPSKMHLTAWYPKDFGLLDYSKPKKPLEIYNSSDVNRLISIIEKILGNIYIEKKENYIKKFLKFLKRNSLKILGGIASIVAIIYYLISIIEKI